MPFHDFKGATGRYSFVVCVIGALALANTPSWAQTTTGNVLHVGPGQQYATIAAAARAAQNGDTVEIEAGQYIGDVAVWLQTNLTIRGVHGRPQLIANGLSAEGKGIWVIRNGNFTVENIEFTGAKVADHNGAGIRFENGTLTLRNCIFKFNEDGILTGNSPTAVLAIEGSEFGNNGYGDGRTHNLYVGQIARLSVTGSYFHHAKAGHLLKSRAKENHIFYNRLTDENGGTASYELEFPNGGLSYVVGNLVQQGPLTQNSTIISYGAEGYVWPQNQIYLINNTIVNERSAGATTLRVAPGVQTIKAADNLLLGTMSTLESSGTGDYFDNFKASTTDFASPATFNYHLRQGSLLVGKAADPGTINGVALRPTREYVYPWQTQTVPGSPYSPGAFQTLSP